MATGTGSIIELRLETEGISGRIRIPPALRPAPGQYLAASAPGSQEPLPVIIFPSQIAEDELQAVAPLPATWAMGMNLSLRGPLGQGFHLPVTARRVALASLEGSPARLLPLAYQALGQHAAVALYARSTPAGLPEEVEVLPPDLLPEALAWADFLALDALQTSLPGLRERLGLNPFRSPGCTIQVLVRAPMPCCGLGMCGICAVTTHGGWSMACSDGPVFDFQQLEGI